MEDINRTYVNVPPEQVGLLLDDLRVDLRDVPHDPPKTTRQPDGNFRVEVSISPVTPISGKPRFFAPLTGRYT